MTYNVFGGTLNPAQSINQELSYISLFSKNVPDQLEPSRRL